jgi:site-specific recombinase XerC
VSKLKDFRWHDLRHTFISRLVIKDVNLRAVQELAGSSLQYAEQEDDLS